ncbi:bifunctional lysylphosphatidylglycerol flippase/synthetase MprF [Pseudoalteromonas rubra]|uniref:Phosphatidylglycerol lysyltransferase C-terminal domain-containing protein n=1 Tax=Pseudoalteromonas rubra TaxID=43658 RepID=A0A0U3I722_9GAMM|nr:DUF2156 domain-containing protein [Pseudoalteromonas rubra]ALU45814.1 hypothetical protein AT705_23080 [Pseudoalteromonas rubra]
MDTVNNFETKNTRLLGRLEYGFLLLISVAVTLYHWQEVRIIPFILLFAYIDLIGYLPGAIAYRKYKGKVPEVYYILYNFAHNFFTAGLVALAWCYFVKPEWALMGILIHLFGDRSLFGNGLKSRMLSFEPVKHPIYKEFEQQITDARKLPSQPIDPVRQFMITEKYGDHPSLFLALNKNISTFCIDGVVGYIPYEDDGSCLFILAGIVAANEDQAALLDGFIEFAKTHKREVAGAQIRQEQAALFEQKGFQVNQMGCSYTLGLESFSLAGKQFMSLRNKIKRAAKAGVTVHELGADIFKGEKQKEMLSEITRSWLQEKGNKKLLSFMVGDLEANDLDKERIFVAVKDDKIIGYISYVPSFGQYQGWMHDLTRRLNDAPPGTMELINAEAINRFKSEGERYLNFGFTPFFGVNDAQDTFPSRSPLLKRTIGFLERHGQKIYPALDQVNYKNKWKPIEQTPEYFVVHGKFRFKHLIRLMRLTNAL